MNLQNEPNNPEPIIEPDIPDLPEPVDPYPVIDPPEPEPEPFPTPPEPIPTFPPDVTYRSEPESE
jgi:hypothetical protein